MTTLPSVLVTDGEERAALAVVRSLGRAGCPTYVAARRQRSLAGASRYVRGRDAVADPLLHASRFVDDVASIARRRRIDVVLPITDAALLALSAHRERLGGVLVPWPAADVVRRVADKALVMDAARAVGIAVPAQRVASCIEEAEGAVSELRYPIVIKPSRSVREQAAGPASKLTVAHAMDAKALTVRLAELERATFPVLLQERVVGPGVGVSMLMREGEVVAHFTHRRLRERPPAGGVSVYAESIAPDTALVESSAALLRRLDWSGVAMVEYKVDERSGTPYLMEINGRFWGSLQLAIDAGVDFPALLVGAARPRVDEPWPYRVGVRFRWWWGDVDHLLVRLLRSPARLSLPPGAPSRARVVRDFLSSGLPHRDSDVLRADDPHPFALETADWLGRRVRAAVGTARAGGARRRRAGGTSAAAPAV